MLECRGRIQGHYPVYLPDSHRYTEKCITQAHLATLHGGVVCTVAKVREQYWVPRLRRLSKRVVKNCHGCRRFQVQAFSSPPQGNLPKDRTEAQTPFQVVGVNYVGPLKYRKGAKTEGMFRCTPVAWLMPCSWICYPVWKLESSSQVSSVSSAKWMKQVMRDEKFQNFLAHRCSSGNSFWVVRPGGEDNSREWWDCSREPFTSPLETGCCPSLNFKKYCWTQGLNNRPLSYVDDDIQLPILTPSSFLYGQPNMLPQLEPHHIQETDLRKRAKYLRKCKDCPVVKLDKRIPAWAQGEAPPKAQGKLKLPIKGRCAGHQIRREGPHSMETGSRWRLNHRVWWRSTWGQAAI